MDGKIYLVSQKKMDSVSENTPMVERFGIF